MNGESETSNEHKAENNPKPHIFIRLWHSLWRRRHWRKLSSRPHVNWAEKVTVLTTAAILIVGIIQARIYWRQAQLMKASLGQNERSIILNMGQLAIAGRTTKASEDALANSRKSVELDERAWLSVHGAATMNPPNNAIEVGKPFDTRIVFQNTGKTPALNVRIIQLKTVKATKGDVPEAVPEMDYSKFPATVMGTLMPYAGVGNAYADLLVTPKLEQADYDAIMGNKLHIFTHGKITYCDVFGKAHWTTWCYHMLSGGGYAVCKNSNDIDADDKPQECSLAKP